MSTGAPAAARPRELDRRVVWAALAAILVLAGALRFYGLAIQSLWSDELSTWEGSAHRIPPSLHEVNPPLYFLMMDGVIRLAGDSETVLRFPSAVAGTLAVLVMFLVGRRLFSDMEGLVSAGLLAVLWPAVFYSQEARPYAMLLLGALASTWLWLDLVARLRGAPERRGRIAWVGAAYAATAAATAYLHYFGLYFVMLQGAAAVGWLVFKRARALLWLVPVYGLIALTFSLWLPSMKTHLGIKSFWIPQPGGNHVWQFCLWQAGYSKIAVAVFFVSAAWVILRAARRAFAGRAGAKLRSEARTPAAEGREAGGFPKGELFIFLWLTAPGALAMVYSLLVTPVLTYRNLIISLPGVCLVSGRAIAVLPVRPLVRALAGAAAVAALALYLVFGLHYYRLPGKEQFRGVVQHVIDNDAKAPNSLVIDASWGLHRMDYYFEHLGSAKRVDLKASQKGDIARIADEIQKRRPDYIWFLYAHRPVDPALLDFLRQHYTEAGGREFRNSRPAPNEPRTPTSLTGEFLDTGALLFRNEAPRAPQAGALH